MTQPRLTCQVLDGRLRRPMAFAARTSSVSTTACSRCTTSMYWGWWLPGTPSMPLSGMFVQMTEARRRLASRLCGLRVRHRELPAGPSAQHLIDEAS
jgi:hypothetical protein